MKTNLQVREIHGQLFIQPPDWPSVKPIAHAVTQGLRSNDPNQVREALDSKAFRSTGVRDAVLGRSSISVFPWTQPPPVDGAPRQGRIGQGLARGAAPRSAGYLVSEGIGIPTLEEELSARGIHVVYVRADHQALDLGQGKLKGLSVYVAGRYAHRMDELRSRGITLVNPHPKSHNSKTVMAETWQRPDIDVSTPETITRLDDDAAVADAYRKLGPDVVVKAALGAHGAQVKSASSLAEAVRKTRSVRNGAGSKAPLMQRRVRMDPWDFRMHFARDWKTGLLHPVAAIERASTSGSFRNNLTLAKGAGAARPIYDLTGGDSVLKAPLINEMKRAGDALHYDNFSADGAFDLDTGKPIVFETDIMNAPIEGYFPTPRAHQTAVHHANLLLFSDNETLEAARGVLVHLH